MEKLDELKALAKEYVQRPEIKARAKELRRVLRGETGNSGWPTRGFGSDDDDDDDDDGGGGGGGGGGGRGSRGGGGGDEGGAADAPVPVPPPPPVGDGGTPGLIR